MGHAMRHCTECSARIEARTASCPECGGTTLIMESESALINLTATARPVPAQHSPWDEEPMVRCSFCHRRIEAAQAYHRLYDGKALCWPCKQAEEA